MHRSTLVAASLLLIGASHLAHAGPLGIQPGEDWFATDSKNTFTVIDIPGTGPVQVFLRGSKVPDSIVERLEPIVIGDPNGGLIQVTSLLLESTAPVDIQGSLFDVFVTLDTGVPNPGGTLVLNTDGTLVVPDLLVPFLLDFQPVVPGQGTPFLEQSTADFGGSPGGFGTCNANTPFTPSISFANSTVTQSHSAIPTPQPPPTPTYCVPVPEPSVIWLFSAGLGVLGARLRGRSA